MYAKLSASKVRDEALLAECMCTLCITLKEGYCS
jgi:hypothetical protein